MSVRVGVGIAGFPFENQAEFWRWVDFCEESRIDSVWLSERLVSTQAFLEPVSAVAAIAGRTQRLKFGMNAVVLPFRDPLVLAKECATIDFLSRGRLLPVFGVGADSAPEWQATGQSAAGRGARANEQLEILRRLWSEDRVTFSGRFYSYKDVSISPRPVQRELPIWIGGASEAAIERTARLGTGWLGGSGSTPEQAGAVVRAIKARLKETARTIEDDHYGVGIAYRFGKWEEEVVERAAAGYMTRLGADTDVRSMMAVGGANEVRGLIDRFVAAGVSKFVLRPVAAGAEDMLEQTLLLDREVVGPLHGG